jgi:hypothetical protein
LDFYSLAYPADHEKHPEIRTALRIFCKMRFKMKSIEYGDIENAIIDTGAPISVIPQQIWENADVEILGTDEMRGIIPDKRCRAPVKVGRIFCQLLDSRGNVSDVSMAAENSPKTAGRFPHP